METREEPRLVQSMIRVSDNLVNTVLDELNKRCNKVMRDTNLYGANTTLNLVPRLRGYGSNNESLEVSTERLYTKTEKLIKKSNPLLALSPDAPLSYSNGSGRSSYGTISIRSSYKVSLLTAEEVASMGWAGNFPTDLEWTRMLDTSSYRSKLKNLLIDKSSIKRYVRYLNYLFRKHGVPILACIDSELARAIPMVDVAYQVTFCKMAWQRSDLTARMLARNDPLSPIEDQVYADPSQWTHGSSYPFEETTNPKSSMEFPQYNVFQNYDKAIQITQTLLRKLQYGPDAYTFRIA